MGSARALMIVSVIIFPSLAIAVFQIRTDRPGVAPSIIVSVIAFVLGCAIGREFVKIWRVGPIKEADH